MGRTCIAPWCECWLFDHMWPCLNWPHVQDVTCLHFSTAGIGCSNPAILCRSNWTENGWAFKCAPMQGGLSTKNTTNVAQIRRQCLNLYLWQHRKLQIYIYLNDFCVFFFQVRLFNSKDDLCLHGKCAVLRGKVRFSRPGEQTKLKVRTSWKLNTTWFGREKSPGNFQRG